MFNFIKQGRAKKGEFELGDSGDMEGQGIMDDGKFWKGKTAVQNSRSMPNELFKIEKREYFEADSKDGIRKTFKQDFQFLTPKCESVEVKNSPEWIKNEKTGQNLSSTTLLPKIEKREYFEADSKDDISHVTDSYRVPTDSSLMNTTKSLSPETSTQPDMSIINLISELVSKLEGIISGTNGKYFCSLCQITFDKDGIESHSKGGKHVSKLFRKNGHPVGENHAKSIMKKLKKDKLFDKIRTNMKHQKEKQFNIKMKKKHGGGNRFGGDGWGGGGQGGGGNYSGSRAVYGGRGGVRGVGNGAGYDRGGGGSMSYGYRNQTS